MGKDKEIKDISNNNIDLDFILSELEDLRDLFNLKIKNIEGTKIVHYIQGRKNREEVNKTILKVEKIDLLIKGLKNWKLKRFI